MKESARYRQILRSTSVFGGVQVFSMLVSLVRSKAIALLIGPAGMGIAGLLNTAISVISNATSLGLETSAVRQIAQVDPRDRGALAKTVSVLRKIVWITGAAGALVVAALSPWLSEITFGHGGHTGSFLWIAATLLFRQLSNGQLAVLQGLQKIKLLARANLAGNLAGLLISLPLYYYWGIDAIVPAIVVSSASALLFSWYFARKVSVDRVRIPARQVFREGRAMLVLGILLSLSALAASTVSYIIHLYISRTGGLVHAGFYSAGFLLLNTYMGMVFSSMGTDYLPRLAALGDDFAQIRESVSRQATVAVLAITPVIVLFVALCKPIIRILFAEPFSAIVPMVLFGVAGMLFRAVSWSVGYVMLARGDSPMFIRTAFFFNALFLALHVAGYRFFGLAGLGAAFAVHYFLHMVILAVLAKKRYLIYPSRDFLQTFGICAGFCALAFLLIFTDGTLRELGFVFLAGASLYYSLRMISEKAGMGFWANRFMRNGK